MDDLFSASGPLGRFLANFEARPAQHQLATAIFRTLQLPAAATGANCLMAEAGTGTGKTLAYLIPAAFSGQKIVISTATRNLQDQILDKDIPFLRRHLAPRLKTICLKGRQNYLCLYRWQQTMASPQLSLVAEAERVTRLRCWVADTDSGDRAELDWLADDDPVWREMSATAGQCFGSACPEFRACFITRQRTRAAGCDLVIVNHHLFFSDLAIRRQGNAELLPRYESVIFDEAHHLEDIATQYFGIGFSHYRLLDLAADLAKAATTDAREAEKLGRRLKGRAEDFAAAFPPERGRMALVPFIERCGHWHETIDATAAAIEQAGDHCRASSRGADAWSGLEARCSAMLHDLAVFRECLDSTLVYWYERRERSVALGASPIEVAGHMAELYGRVRSAVFTSATLAVNGSFTYFRERMGIPAEAETLVVEAPFDYRNRALVFVPGNDFPLPTEPAYAAAARAMIRDILALSRGRALVLFTSITAMQACAPELRRQLPYDIFVQGEAPRKTLLERFRDNTHSVLLAVASFWEGVDVPGEALSCVIIDKLPFEVPSDPVLQVRIERIRGEGGNPFFDLQIPRAILALRQGVGRLLRNRDDRGVIAILDTRLFGKGYGRRFLRSLPPAPVSRDLAAVARFFAATATGNGEEDTLPNDREQGM
ncbi:MAG: ATP-dependent DNA helicase [Thermodesulfobacteriota bacterium]